MIELSAALLFIVAIAASFFAAWTIGAGSSGSTPFAPAVGANAITTLRAAFVVGLLGFAGAVLQGAAVTETVGEGLIEGVTLSPLASAIALTIAATYIAAGVFAGYPIATAFAITGSVVGVGLAIGGEPAWGTYTEIGLYWLVTPIAVAPPSYALTLLLRGTAVSEKRLVAALAGIVGVVVANMEFLFLGPPGEQASLATAAAAGLPGPSLVGAATVTLAVAAVVTWIVARSLERDSVAAQRRFLLALGALVAFTAGAGKVGLAVGPLLPLVEGTVPVDAVVPVLVFGGIGILLGSWMAAPRMIKALSQDYSELGPRRSIAVLIPSFVFAQIGIFFGIPMSFNQIFIGAMAGVGYAVGGDTVSERKLVVTAVAWIGSLVFGLVVGYGLQTAAVGLGELL
ncbi:inorganic phosphate transporter [Natronococcus sp. A-GB7]|uniref:inorganic phosphate transporter n=1 Tax=Natronococcus sp. A-GB7 TaxID=3037649 RepID=UPI00241D79A8|nr:inorganic phosphate transporter [Natronococcus sp. A-GB7]MDG5819193.1 inorganic phosphate transporter [Natronococcus sp. A-GB7]